MARTSQLNRVGLSAVLVLWLSSRAMRFDLTASTILEVFGRLSTMFCYSVVQLAAVGFSLGSTGA